MPKAQKHYEDCSKSCTSTARIPSQQIQDSSRDEPRFTVAIGPNGQARTPLLDQDADRTFAKFSRAVQLELSEALTPLPDVPDTGTLVAAVPVQRDRRSMSRRPGQNGCIEKRGDTFSYLFCRDVPGSTKRQQVRRTLKATTMVAAKQEAQIVRAVYNFYLDETLQQGKTTMLPWLIKWSKVGPTAKVTPEYAK